MDGDAEHKDALSQGRVRGRGAGLNPGNRFEDLRLHVLGEHLDRTLSEHPEGVQVATRIHEDRTRSIINPVNSPDIGFKWTVNPYRGCEHGCIYCYARPTHETLGLSSGLDFETRIIAKPDAPALLRKALASKRWTGEPIVMSGVTDPYQPVESRLRITRACLELMAECRQPVSVITKNRLVLRDLDLLDELNRHRATHVAVSLTTLDNRLAARMEPRASGPQERLDTISALSARGIPVAVMTAPIVPALNDHEVPALLKAARDAGATSAGYVLLRLPHQIKDLFLEWARRHFPDRAAKIEAAVRETRGGELYNADFFRRQRGEGPRAEGIGRAFKLFSRRLGMNAAWTPLSSAAFRRPGAASSGDTPTLFDLH